MNPVLYVLKGKILKNYFRPVHCECTLMWYKSLNSCVDKQLLKSSSKSDHLTVQAEELSNEKSTSLLWESLP